MREQETEVQLDTDKLTGFDLLPEVADSLESLGDMLNSVGEGVQGE